jgi:hypothetical protein
MKSSSESPKGAPEDFSLILGGPMYQFLLRLGLVKPPLDRIGWRMLVISLVAWAPLLVLTIFNGRFLSGVRIPFLHDLEVHVRLLVFLPLMIAAEVTIHRRMKVIVSQFLERQIITPAMKTRFGEIIDSAMRLRNSAVIELGLLAFVCFVGGYVWRETVAVQSDTWYATVAAGGPVRTPAGFWYQFVSIPISQFIMLRWYFRLFIWTRFLFQVSKLDLNLVPTHPDKSCGLGFLDGIIFAMAPFLIAHTCLLSGAIANRLLYEGAKLTAYYVEIGTLAVFLCLVVLGPLCLFTPSLSRARRLGLRVYGRLASDYVIGFDRKWIGGQRPPEEPLVGTGDIQSLADLANSFAVVQSISPFPFGKNSLIGLVVIIVLPLLPLGLTMFSPQELLLRLVKLVL